MSNGESAVGADRTAARPTNSSTEAEELRLIFELAPIGMATTTLDGQFVRVNRAFCNMVGYTAEELLQRTFADITHPDDVPQSLAIFAQLLTAEVPEYEFEKRYVHKSGTIVHVILRAALIRDAHNQPHRVIAQVVDISQRKQTEERLRWLSRAVEQSPSIVIITDLADQIEYVNPAFVELTGYTVEEAVSMKASELGDQLPEETERMHKSLLAGEQWRGEFYNRKKNGERYWTLASLSPIRDAQGVVTHYLSIQEDITQRKHIEQALRESEARYRAVVEDQTELICRALPDGTLTFVNDAYCRYFGRTREELLGTNFMPLIPEVDQEEVRERLSSLNPKNLTVTYEHRVIRPDGEVGWQQWTDRALFDRQGVLIEIQSVGRDITEIKQAEQTVFQSEKMKSLGILAGGIAHDFNNLLVAMLGQISLAELKLPAGDPIRSHLGKAARAAERAADLARQMLAYSGSGHFQIQPLNLNHVIEEYLSLFVASLPKNIQLRHTLTGPLPEIEADPSQIQQVIMNLLINAAEAVGDRSGTVTIATDTRSVRAGARPVMLYTRDQLPIGKYVVLKVQDDGDGMDMETLERIFDPFFTTKFTGRGLGLAAVLGIVNGHKAGLKVHSRKGKGTSFILFFPTREMSSESASASSSSSTDPVFGPNMPTILVIDDEESVREAAIDILEASGMRVLSAEDGQSGVALYREHKDHIQLVLLDLSMHGLNGEQTLYKLRNVDPDVRVLVSSGYTEKAVMRRFADSPVLGFMKKPYDATTLLERIRQFIT